MAQDEQLTVRIRADVGNAVSGTSEVAAAFDRLAALIIANGVSGEKAGAQVAAGQEVAAKAATHHAEAQTVLGATIGKTEVATNSAARVFGILGFRTGEATERVLALTEALDALKTSAGPLLLIGAAALALGAAFGALSEGVEIASEMESAMASLGVAVTNAGGSFDEAKDKIESFLQTESEATGFTKGELVSSLRDLVDAGVSVGDAMKILSVSEDVARASGRSLTDVTNAIKSAELGRPQGLERIDIGLKSLIQSHASLSVVLTKLASDMSGSAAASAETLAGKQRSLDVAFDEVKETIGNALLPVLKDLNDMFIGSIKVGGDFGHAISDVFIGIGETVGSLAKKLGFTATALFDFFHMDFKGGAEAFHQALAVDMTGAKKRYSDGMNEIGLVFEEGDLGATGRSVEAAHAAARTHPDLSSLDYDPNLGTTGKGHHKKAHAHAEKPAENYGADIVLDAEPTNRYATAQKALDEQMRALTDSERGYKIAVDLSTTASGQAAAKSALETKEKSDALQASILLSRAINQETSERKAAEEAVVDQTAATHAVGKAYNTLLDAMNASGHATAAQKLELKELKQVLDEHTKTLHTAQTAVSTLTGEIDKNTAALEAQKQKYEETGKAAAAKALAENVAATKLAEQGVKERADRVTGLVDEEATYKKSLEQQLAYYQARYAASVAAHGLDAGESKKYYDEIIKLEGEQFKKRADAYTTFISTATSIEKTFIDDVISKHKSLRDSLADVWKSILADYVKMIEEMILKSALFKGLNASIAGAFGIGGGGGSLFGGGASGGIGSVVSLAPDATKALTGSTSGVDANSVQAVLNSSSSSGIIPIAGDASGMSGSYVKPGLSSGGNAARTAGVVGGALQIGQGLSPGGTFSETLGGVGAAVGSIYGGPVGAAIGEVAGSLIGSLFGPHINAYNNPDIKDTQNYAQGLANATGKQAGANGYTAQADSGILGLTGGVGEIAFTEKLLAQGKDAFMKATGESATQYDQALKIFGASTTGAGTISFGKNIGDQTIVGATSGGNTQTRYDVIDNLLSDILKGYSAKGGTPGGAAPQFSISRSYPDMNIGKLMDSAGAVVAGAATSGHGTMSGVGPVPPIVLNLTVGTVAGAGGLQQLGEDLAGHIGVALGRINGGQIPGGFSSVGAGGRQRYRGSA